MHLNTCGGKFQKETKKNQKHANKEENFENLRSRMLFWPILQNGRIAHNISFF